MIIKSKLLKKLELFKLLKNRFENFETYHPSYLYPIQVIYVSGLLLLFEKHLTEKLLTALTAS